MYDAIFRDVKAILSGCEYATKNALLPFRTRSAHIWRVFLWARRLMGDQTSDRRADEESLLTAALFHDTGYALQPDGQKHADGSAVLFSRYMKEKGIAFANPDFIISLIRNHSAKSLMREKDTPIELILLMEADLLDETGAMTIAWDCMAEGAQTEQSFEGAYRRIEAFTRKQLAENPMVTESARAIWADKQALIRRFMSHLAFDLGIDGYPPLS